MRHNRLIAMVLIGLVVPGVAMAQAFNARRMGMGGVILARGGQGSEEANVAYRAVPARPDSGFHLPLPIGLVPVLLDPPELDPDEPDFNAFELANLLYNPPWNLQLTHTEPPASDVTISIARNHLAVDLGEVSEIFPEEDSRITNSFDGPTGSWGVGPVFGAIGVLSHVENDLRLNDALRGALRDGEPFTPLTTYELFDDAEAQTAAAAMLGAAIPLLSTGDPRGAGFGVYGGVRARLLRGIAYGRADNVAAFRTLDTLFASNPVDIRYNGELWNAGPEDGRWGRSFDVGVAFLGAGFEGGIGVNQLAARIDWRVRHSLVYEDSAASEYVQDILAEDVPYTSELPVVVTANVASHVGPMLVAADVVHSDGETAIHAGVERWVSLVALRAGMSLDTERRLQGSVGAGLRLGPVGVDLALASHSRNVTHERALELGAGLTIGGGPRP